MNRVGYFITSFFLSVLIACSSAQKAPKLEGQWECYKRERKSGCDTISNGNKITCIPDPWVITSNQMEIVKGDPVNYVRKDSVIYIKGFPYYKIEKLSKGELVLLEIYCDNEADCKSNEKHDLWDRRYFKRIK